MKATMENAKSIGGVSYFTAEKYGKKQITVTVFIGTADSDRKAALKDYKKCLQDGQTIIHTGQILPDGFREWVDWEVDVKRDEAGNVLWEGPDGNMIPFILSRGGWYRGTFVRKVEDADGTITSTEGRKTYRMSY